MFDGIQMGWYSESATAITIEDYIQNGKYCESGLAFPSFTDKTNTTLTYWGNCTSVDKITFNGTLLDEPYPCNPMA
jgi:hypothetical protein